MVFFESKPIQKFQLFVCYLLSGVNSALDTSAIERSFERYGAVISNAVAGQNYITDLLRNQLNASLVNQDQQTITMQQIAAESQRRGYDRFFAAVPIFDGTDPDMFDGWVEKLETACRISRRDIREEAICYSGGPVRQMIMTMPDDSTWADIKSGDNEELLIQENQDTCSSVVNSLQEAKGE